MKLMKIVSYKIYKSDYLGVRRTDPTASAEKNFLGGGTQGIVASVTDKATGEHICVIKKSKGSYANGLKYESKTLRKLEGLKHITQAKAFFEGKNKSETPTNRLVLEACDGSLAPSADSPKISYTLILTDALLGLKEMHERRLAHMDIKPENLLYKKDKKTGHYTIKLCDFGCAFDPSNPESEISVSGTLGFQTPEFLNPIGISREREVFLVLGQKNDIFALGMSLVSIISGQPIAKLIQTYMATITSKREVSPSFSMTPFEEGRSSTNPFSRASGAKTHKSVASFGSLSSASMTPSTEGMSSTNPFSRASGAKTHKSVASLEFVSSTPALSPATSYGDTSSARASLRSSVSSEFVTSNLFTDPITELTESLRAFVAQPKTFEAFIMSVLRPAIKSECLNEDTSSCIRDMLIQNSSERPDAETLLRRLWPD